MELVLITTLAVFQMLQFVALAWLFARTERHVSTSELHELRQELSKLQGAIGERLRGVETSVQHVAAATETLQQYLMEHGK